MYCEDASQKEAGAKPFPSHVSISPNEESVSATVYNRKKTPVQQWEKGGAVLVRTASYRACILTTGTVLRKDNPKTQTPQLMPGCLIHAGPISR